MTINSATQSIKTLSIMTLKIIIKIYIQHNDTQHNVIQNQHKTTLKIQYMDIEQNGTWYNNKNATLSIMIFTIMNCQYNE